MLYHDPDDDHKIVINGVGISNARNRLNILFQQNPTYAEFTVSTNELSIGPSVDDGPSIASLINLCATHRCSLSSSSTVSRAPISVIELILKGSDTGSQRSEYTSYYAITTAHSFTTDEQYHALKWSYEDHKNVWAKISDESWFKRPYMLVPRHKPIDIIDRPLPLLRYFYRADQHDERFIVNDIALLKLQREQLNEDGWLSKDISSQYGQAASERRQPRGQPPSEDTNEICDIKSPGELDQYLGKRIRCGGKSGQTVRPTVMVDKKWAFGTHIAFVLDGHQQ